MMAITTDDIDILAPQVQAGPAVVCKPTPADLPGLVTLVNAYARRGDLLPRTPESIRDTLDDWVIGKLGGDNGRAGTIVACGSLLMYSPVLAEVRSLAVADAAQGTGLGRKVVEALIKEACEREIPTLFALTRVVGFFQKMGFEITEKEYFPQKVWNDCSICPLKENCDETAVVRQLAMSNE